MLFCISYWLLNACPHTLLRRCFEADTCLESQAKLWRSRWIRFPGGDEAQQLGTRLSLGLPISNWPPFLNGHSPPNPQPVVSIHLSSPASLPVLSLFLVREIWFWEFWEIWFRSLCNGNCNIRMQIEREMHIWVCSSCSPSVSPFLGGKFGFLETFYWDISRE